MKQVLLFAFIPCLFTTVSYKAIAQDDNEKKNDKKGRKDISVFEF